MLSKPGQLQTGREGAGFSFVRCFFCLFLLLFIIPPGISIFKKIVSVLSLAIWSFSKGWLKNIFFCLFLVPYLWPCWIFLAVWAFLQLQWMGVTLHSLVGLCRLLIAVASLIMEPWLWGVCASVLVKLGLYSFGLVAPRHMGSSQIMDRTPVSCIGRRILYHRANRETQSVTLGILNGDVCCVSAWQIFIEVGLKWSWHGSSLRIHIIS